MRKLALLALFVLAPQLSAVDAISSSVVKIGEPFFVTAEFSGGEDVRVGQRSYSHGGVTAVYSGIEDMTTIVNMNVTRKKIVKFRIVMQKPGNYSTPPIALQVDGKPYSIKPVAFQVLNEKYTSHSMNPFGGFFPGDRVLSENEVKVKFFTERDQVYVGEAITGYFVLLYTSGFEPLFERDPSSAVSFPYFLNKTLDGVTLKIPAEVVYDNARYNTSPYQEEVFLLTPLKSGDYNLGDAKFHIAADRFSQPFMLESIPVPVRVKELPRAVPPNFSGEVGDYEIKMESAVAGVVGESLYFRLLVAGEGGLEQMKDPAASLCHGAACQISLVQAEKKHQFKRLPSGKFGMYSEAVFEYSLVADKPGKLRLADLDIVFFDPRKEKYVTRKVTFRDIVIKEASKKEEQAKPMLRIPYRWKKTAFWILFMGFVLFGLYRFRVWERWGPQTESFAEFAELDRIIGNKKGILLGNYLKHKKLSATETSLVVALKQKYPLLEFQAIAGQIGQGERQTLKAILNKLKENQ